MEKKRQHVHYVHQLSYSAQERLVGLFVLGALGVLIGLFIVGGKTAHLFEERITYYVFMKNAEGVSTDTEIRVSGISVGEVERIDITIENDIKVTLSVFDRYKNLVRTDAKASLNQLSLFGQSSIDITAGASDLSLLLSGSTIPFTEPVSVDELMGKITPVLENINLAVAESVDLIAALTAISTKVASGKGTVGTVVFSDKFGQQFTKTFDTLGRTLDATEKGITQLTPIIVDVGKMTADASSATNEIPELIRESIELVAQLNVAVSTVNFELQQFPDLVVKTRVLMEEAQNTLDSLQRIWPLSAALDGVEDKILLEARPSNE